MGSALRQFCCRAAGLVVLLALPFPVRGADVPAVAGRLLVGHRAGVDPVLFARTLVLHHATVREHLAPLGATVLEIPAESADLIARSLRSTGLFDYVEPDYYGHTSAVPNDPSFGSQWHLTRIQTPEAWGVTTGLPAVIVAVIDSGVYAEHPDLQTKTVPGWNFVKSNYDTSDVLGHGTAVAGTIAAHSNNGIGVAAVTWGSLVMPLVAVDENDYAAYSNVAAAIVYAADHGVRIINISIGGTNPSATLQNAVDYAWNKGSIVFASAMNNSTSNPYYPAACNHVVSVAATDSYDHLAGFSNYGDWITLSAPGTNILTTMNGGGYGYWSGTSFASPIVAGVASLVLAVNPALTNSQILDILKRTADDLGSNGFDSSCGWGRINAYRATYAAWQAIVPPTGSRSPQLLRGPAPAHHR